MGAMENKSLNVFNTSLTLAREDTATDDDYERIEGVIGHEYFHNWTNFLPEKNWNHRKAGPYPSCEVDLAWSPHDSLRSVDSFSLMLSVTVMKLETFLWVLCSGDSGDSGDFAFFSCVLHCFQKFYGDSFKTVF